MDADCPKTCQGGLYPGNSCLIYSDCPLGECVGSCDEGTLGPTPFYKLSSQWGTAKVRGTDIRPGTTYSVRTLADFSAGAAFSSAAAATTWTWGDVDHNGMVNVLDVTNLVNALKNLWGPFTFEQMNLWGSSPSAPCAPDSMLDVLDVVSAVDAVKEKPFPCSQATCTTGDLPPPNPYFLTGRRLDFDLRAGDPGASLADLPPGTVAGSSVLTLYDYRAREYDARHGRFLQRDPAGYVDGMNLYEAFSSNPLRFVDPFGARNTVAYERDKQTHDQWYADFMDMLGVYDVTPERNALAEDAIGLVKELAGRRQLIKELGGQIASGVEILGAFNDGADLAIVLNEWSEGRVNVAQFAILLPLIGNGHIKLLSKCGKELKVFRGTGPDKLSTILPVRELRKFLRGTSKGDKEIHHLIELRFHPALGISNADDVEGVLISALEHRGVGAKQLSDAVEGEIEKSLTQLFREAIPYRPRNDPEYYRKIPVQVIYEAHRDVYARFGVPDLIEKIKPWFAAVGANVE